METVCILQIGLQQTSCKRSKKSDIIMKKMNDPRFMQAMQEFQNNPHAALAKHAGDEDMESFLKEFCSILGKDKL